MDPRALTPSGRSPPDGARHGISTPARPELLRDVNVPGPDANNRTIIPRMHTNMRQRGFLPFRVKV